MGKRQVVTRIELQVPSRTSIIFNVMNKQTTITLNLDSKVVKKFEKQLKDLDGGTFQEWLEMEFNKNGDALLEMLLGDY
jgi:hypothetical protein